MTDSTTLSGLAANPIVKIALERFLKRLVKHGEVVARRLLTRASVELKLGFEEYLLVSYQKCVQFKTLLNPHEPLETVPNYVHVSLTCGKTCLTDDELIQRVPEYKYINIIGLAGSGKSMLMKYLTMRYFEGLHDLTPLFVELRHLNHHTTPDLLSYIRIATTRKGGSITQEVFEASLRSGALLFVLDGFDEVKREYKDKIQMQILALRKDFPEVPIIVSSRPDDRFGSWQAFHGFTVDKLSLEQCRALIRGLSFDESIKGRFERAVAAGLYNSHTSFLSSPLLTTIMLLTYADFAEIPHKMHAFYSQAFDTLYQKHDALKDQFQRDTHSQLTRQDFKVAFAAFSAFSYADQKYSFDDDSLIRTADSALAYLRQAGEVVGTGVTSQTFVSDLKQSVCLLQPDGTDTTYVHRSFQEYFASLFATYLRGELARKFMDICSLRPNDSVMLMLRDMAGELTEREWVLPTIAQLREDLAMSDTKSLSDILRKIFAEIYISHEANGITFTALLVDQLVSRLQTLAVLYPRFLSQGLIFEPLKHLSLSDARKTWNGAPNPGSQYYTKLRAFLYSREKRQHLELKSGDLNAETEWMFHRLDYAGTFTKVLDALTRIEVDVRTRLEKRDSLLEALLASSKADTPRQRKRREGKQQA